MTAFFAFDVIPTPLISNYKGEVPDAPSLLVPLIPVGSW